jgi:hypothetical protein
MARITMATTSIAARGTIAAGAGTNHRHTGRRPPITNVPATLPQPSLPPSAAPTAKNRIDTPRYATAKGMSTAFATPVFSTSNGATPSLASRSNAIPTATSGQAMASRVTRVRRERVRSTAGPSRIGNVTGSPRTTTEQVSRRNGSGKSNARHPEFSSRRYHQWRFRVFGFELVDVGRSKNVSRRRAPNPRRPDAPRVEVGMVRFVDFVCRVMTPRSRSHLGDTLE